MRMRMHTLVNGNIQLAMSQETTNECLSTMFSNHDHLFGNDDNCAKRALGHQNDEGNERENIFLSSENNIAERRSTSTDCCQQSYKSILAIESQIVELTKVVNLMRKQMSRIELKSMVSPQDEDVLSDFESSLANENLPLKTCIEVNDFEAKLRNNSEYRNKMVKYFTTFVPMVYTIDSLFLKVSLLSI